MNAVVQHKSGLAQVQGGNNFGTLALNSNVTKGNLIIVAMTDFECEETTLVGDLADSQGNTYQLAVQQYSTLEITPAIAAIFYTIASASGPLTLTWNNTLPTLAPFIHVYEVNGAMYNALDQTGFMETNVFASSFSVSTTAKTLYQNEFVLAVFLGLGSGSGQETWTGQAGNEATETFQNSTGTISTFSEAFEVASAGIITASASESSNQMTVVPALIATFNLKQAGLALGGSPEVYPLTMPVPQMPRGVNRTVPQPPHAHPTTPGSVPRWLQPRPQGGPVFPGRK